MTSFWGSTAAIDQLTFLHRQGAEGSAALRRAALTEAARRALRKRVSSAGLTSKQAGIARLLLLDASCVGAAIEVIGTVSRWAEEAGCDRGTVAAALVRLRTLGLFEILKNGGRHHPWMLRWEFDAAEWQSLEEETTAMVRRMLTDAPLDSNINIGNLSKITI